MASTLPTPGIKVLRFSTKCEAPGAANVERSLCDARITALLSIIDGSRSGSSGTPGSSSIGSAIPSSRADPWFKTRKILIAALSREPFTHRLAYPNEGDMAVEAGGATVFPACLTPS
jgi:hypothetical protein